jgi:hypothetical protein
MRHGVNYKRRVNNINFKMLGVLSFLRHTPGMDIEPRPLDGYAERLISRALDDGHLPELPDPTDEDPR